MPEGYVRKMEAKPRSNPKLTLVFMAYQSNVSDIKKQKTLINVSHIAHKFISSDFQI